MSAPGGPNSTAKADAPRLAGREVSGDVLRIAPGSAARVAAVGAACAALAWGVTISVLVFVGTITGALPHLDKFVEQLTGSRFHLLGATAWVVYGAAATTAVVGAAIAAAGTALFFNQATKVMGGLRFTTSSPIRPRRDRSVAGRRAR